MARLIVKSPYYKCGGKSSVSGYLRYIATRERVERLPDDRPPTRKQEQLIAKLSKDFPDTRMLDEYGDYREQPTKANASALISMVLESNWDSLSSMESYAGYIATRPRAERLGSHGLLGDADGVDLKEAMKKSPAVFKPTDEESIQECLSRYIQKFCLANGYLVTKNYYLREMFYLKFYFLDMVTE